MTARASLPVVAVQAGQLRKRRFSDAGWRKASAFIVLRPEAGGHLCWWLDGVTSIERHALVYSDLIADAKPGPA